MDFLSSNLLTNILLIAVIFAIYVLIQTVIGLGVVMKMAADRVDGLANHAHDIEVHVQSISGLVEEIEGRIPDPSLDDPRGNNYP